MFPHFFIFIIYTSYQLKVTQKLEPAPADFGYEEGQESITVLTQRQTSIHRYIFIPVGYFTSTSTQMTSLDVFAQWEETRASGGNPHGHRDPNPTQKGPSHPTG